MEALLQDDDLVQLTNITGPTGLHGLKWTYGIFMPIISTLGIVGNCLTLYVLLSSNKKFTTGFIFSYIKSLAVVDTIQLLFSLQVSQKEAALIMFAHCGLFCLKISIFYEIDLLSFEFSRHLLFTQQNHVVDARAKIQMTTQFHLNF